MSSKLSKSGVMVATPPYCYPPPPPALPPIIPPQKVILSCDIYWYYVAPTKTYVMDVRFTLDPAWPPYLTGGRSAPNSQGLFGEIVINQHENVLAMRPEMREGTEEIRWKNWGGLPIAQQYPFYFTYHYTLSTPVERIDIWIRQRPP